MLNNNQLEYFKTLDEIRLIEYLGNRPLDELKAIKQDIEEYIKPENILSKEDRVDYMTKLSIVDAKISGLSHDSKETGLVEELIDTSKFQPLNTQGLIDTLGLTIKKDNENKIITFMCTLSAYTEDSQLNISFNAPSSSGKSYIPLEIAKLFPDKDIIQVGYCSPTAFFHSHGTFDKDKQGYTVDLSRKILIFLDQPHTQLLQHLRPLLSHDKKEIEVKITDKSQKFGLKTKNIYLVGYPSVIFCTAGLRLDEQEATRFLLLSPEINQEKIRDAILEKIKKTSDSCSYKYNLETNEKRMELKQRILAIKQAKISEIIIKNPENVEKMFFERIKTLKPRHQRDVGRIMSLIKIFTLFNIWFREHDGSAIIANEDDIQEAFKLYDIISESQELNLPPYVHELFKNVILEVYEEKNLDDIEIDPQGVSRQEIMQKHFKVYGRFLPDWQLRQQIIPMLETAGLITQEQDPRNKRNILIYPTTQLIKSKDKNNSESDSSET